MDISSLADILRVLIVADDPLVRAGLAALLADRLGCSVVGQVSGSASLPEELEIYRPDAILWDLGWHAGPGGERLADFGGAGLPIVAILPDASHAAGVWAAGIRGLLLRDASPATIVAALRAVFEGLVVLAPELSLAAPRSHGPEPPPLPEELTPRETEVLRLLAEGLPNKAIAQRLGISEHTVKFHVNAVMGKLGAQSRTEAIVLATRLGLIFL